MINRLRNFAYDIRHPLTTIERKLAYRYCRRFNLVLVDRDSVYVPRDFWVFPKPSTL